MPAKMSKEDIVSFMAFKDGWKESGQQLSRDRKLALITAAFVHVVHGWANWAIPEDYLEKVPEIEGLSRQGIRNLIVDLGIPVYSKTWIYNGDIFPESKIFANPKQARKGWRERD